MEAFLGLSDGKYHIPGFGLGQVTSFPLSEPEGGARPDIPGKQGFFLS
jgi:hypothetical protein